MKKVLIVDDDSATRFAVEQGLKAEYQVISRPNGVGLIDLVQSQKPDIVLLDIHLPGSHGVTLLKELKSSPVSTTNVFMVTVRGDEDTILKCFELGASDYIVKPFSLAVLKARIKRWVSHVAPDNEPANLQVGNAKIDLRAGRIIMGNEEFQLSSKEHLVLSFLLSNRNQIISRQQILDFAWGYDYFGTSRTVDNIVSSLRKKLGDEKNDQETISSHRGMGYRLNL